PPRPSGAPARPISSMSIAALRPPAGGAGRILLQIGVSMMPGCTVLTRMLSPRAAHSIAIALPNSRTPPFVAQYPARVAEPRSPAIEEVMMIDPPPDLRISGRPYLTDRKTPSRLTAV